MGWGGYGRIVDKSWTGSIRDIHYFITSNYDSKTNALIAMHYDGDWR